MDNRKNTVNLDLPEHSPSCYTDVSETEITLVSPHFEFRLNHQAELKSKAWKNLFTQETLLFDKGLELEVDMDHSYQRINIVGWKAALSQQAKSHPDEEFGFKNNYAAYAFDDSSWKGRITPVPFKLNEPYSVQQEDHYHWTRTHVFFPEEARDEKITLTLGGMGMFRYTFMRVFMNGFDLGVHEQQERWNEPAEIELTPQHPAYATMRFGQDNVIALQLTGLTTRPDELKQIDPKKTKNLPYKNWWPCQFEQYVTIQKKVQTLSFNVTSFEKFEQADHAELHFHLQSVQAPVTALVIYRWQADQPTLHKHVTLTNTGDQPLMLLHVRLGQYELNEDVSDGEQGFPVYIHDQYFMALAHPSGWAIGQHRCVTLKQYPGKLLNPNQTFDCMEVVFGVAHHKQIRTQFLTHITRRMRRVVRNHQKPYAIYEPFGARKMEESNGPPPFILKATEAFIMDNLNKLAEVEKHNPSHFDYYCIQFWVNSAGDFTTADPQDFPNDFTQITRQVQAQNMKLGLWIDSSWTEWSIGKNPVATPSKQFILDYGTEDYVGFCRASEPIHSLYTNGFIHHLRENQVELLKFDNLFAICYNHHHEHLPGIYSTEAIQSKMIEFLNRMDQENPNVLLMLYWGYRSPWWLLHGDTLFEPGLHLEASHPGSSPTMYVRDSIIKGLDQAHWWCKDIPQLGKDSLGVWLSDWPWNSSVGKERWQEAFIMDMFRGGLLAQPWANEDWLTAPEAKQLAHFIQLMREYADCFGNTRLFHGHPWKREAYSYVASNDQRAFIVLFNCVWEDSHIPIDMRTLLPNVENRSWEMYRHYPNPSKLHQHADPSQHTFPEQFSIYLRPFELMFIEIVSSGQTSSLTNQVENAPLLQSFPQSSCEVNLHIDSLPEDQAMPVPHEAVFASQVPVYMTATADEEKKFPPKRTWIITADVPASLSGGMFVVSCQLNLGSDAYLTSDIGNYFACEVTLNQLPIANEPVVRNWTLPCPWQAWRMDIPPSAHNQKAELHVTFMSPADVDTLFSSTYIPR